MSDVASVILTRCLACERAFPASDELEWLSVGRRVAFDAARGRLWIICGWCGHWSLTPMEQRWEAVEELERRAQGRAVVLAATPHVALLALGSMEVLRVGGAPAAEEAWWRYGRSLRGRRLHYNRMTGACGFVASALAATATAGFVLIMPDVALLKWRSIRSVPGHARRSGAEAAESVERLVRYGRYAWRGVAPCGRCGHELSTLRFRDRGAAVLLPDGTVQVRCMHCRSADGWHVVAGDSADSLVRRLLAYENIAGATDAQLDAACALVRAGAAHVSQPRSLRRAPREELIALELIAAQRFEAHRLGWEISELEARWRSEEHTAAIIDRELTPPASNAEFAVQFPVERAPRAP